MSYKGIGGLDIRGEAEKAGTIVPQEENTYEYLTNALKYLLGGLKKTKLDYSQGCTVKEQEAMVTSWNIGNAI